MKTIELCAGTKSFSKVASRRGHSTFTVDIEPSLSPDLVFDLTKELPPWLWDAIKNAQVVWMSPVCTGFSMASGNTHWTADRQPKTTTAILSRDLLLKCKEIAEVVEAYGGIYFIENPRARARWFMPMDETHHEVWYCKYGDTRAKPTDIWTNLKGWTAKKCRNGATCHDAAPRGSKTGTQGIKGAKDRGAIPPKLFEEIFDVIERSHSRIYPNAIKKEFV